MHVLGISAFFRDSAAALVRDGEVVAAAEEARFSRRPGDSGFPRHAVRHCLETAGLKADAVDYIGFADKPLVHLERAIEGHVALAPAGFAEFRRTLPELLGRRLRVARELDGGLGLRKRRYVFAPHHEALAAAAFFPSPYEEAAILTIGEGEWGTVALGAGRGNELRIDAELRHPHALGGLRAAFARYLGCAEDAMGELAALASGGEPQFVAPILEHVVDVRPDGSFRIDGRCVRAGARGGRTTARFHGLFGGAPREPGDPVEGRHRDLAVSIEHVLAEIVARALRHLRERTRSANVVFATDGVLDAAAERRLLHASPFESSWSPPVSGGAAGALGVALLIEHQLLRRERTPRVAASLNGSLHGPRWSMEAVEACLRGAGARYAVLADEARDARVAELLAAGRVVAWFHGRMEFGARAFGARALLCDPRRADAIAALGRSVEYQDAPRPHVVCVLAESAAQWPSGGASVHAIGPNGPAGLRGVLRAFERATGCPALAVSAFQRASEPVVASPDDAWRTFMSCEIDALALENALVVKSELRAPLEARRAAPDAQAERDPALEDLLRCPACGGALRVDGGRARCGPCNREFAREEGIWRLFQPVEPYTGDVTELVQGFYEEHPFPNYEEHESLRSLVDKARAGVYARLLGEQIPFDARVLEVGCGTGQLSNFLGIGCRTVVGADLCLNSLRLAEGFRARHKLDRVRFAQMNLFKPAFAPGSFDVVLCNGVLLTTRDPRAGFESIARLVKPGGHIVIGLYNWWGRLPVDARRVIFRLTGGRMLWLDPRLSEVADSPEKVDAWYHDQYLHPHETKQTQGEVLEWFERAGFDFVNAVPKTNPWEPFTDEERLFEQSTPGTSASRALAQAKMILTGWIEGGFFVMIGKRRSAE